MRHTGTWWDLKFTKSVRQNLSLRVFIARFKAWRLQKVQIAILLATHQRLIHFIEKIVQNSVMQMQIKDDSWTTVT